MIKLFECFAGYGGASFALKKAGIPFELIGYSEINKYADYCFNLNHGSVNYGDITKINWALIPDFDLLTGGFPCQDVSNAGKQDLSKSRTILGHELTKALLVKQPEYFIFENVKGILSKKFKDFLNTLLEEWKNAGYVVIYKCLNSKDFGIPQNRQRVIFVGIRKDIYQFNAFSFPGEEPLKLKLSDLLEKEVEPKYYLSEKATLGIQRALERKHKPTILAGEGVCSTLDSRVGALTHRSPYLIHNVYGGFGETEPRVFNDTAPTIRTPAGGGHLPYVVSNNNLRLGQGNTIRRLTPKECFRLMGFLNDEIKLDGLSDTQKYKLAGNGWEINLFSKIFKALLK